jgi:2-amino-4-hydroxy-6-hydroxymethyldihydropteridine diphosphokinase
VTRAYIGLGSNLGDRLANLSAALTSLAGTCGVRVAGVSSAYESEPWGGVEQPAYANAVAALDVEIEAAALLTVCKRIESELGRTGGVTYGPRPIDLDILLFGDERIETPDLCVPHPRMLERDFVVTPLLEIAAGIVLPDGTTPRRDSAVEGRIMRRLGPVPGAWAGGTTRA